MMLTAAPPSSLHSSVATCSWQQSWSRSGLSALLALTTHLLVGAAAAPARFLTATAANEDPQAGTFAQEGVLSPQQPMTQHPRGLLPLLISSRYRELQHWDT